MLLHKQQSTDGQPPLSVVDSKLKTSTDDEDVTVAVNEWIEERDQKFLP